jgi:site-specific DNA-methyltransferase (adenine-specific)
MRLIHGNCIDELKKLQSEHIDLTITSPPYDSMRSYKDQDAFTFNVFSIIANELLRVTKRGGVVVWIVGDATLKGSETGTSFRQALHFKDIGFRLHDTMIYQKQGPPKTHNRYEQHFEYMFILAKGRPNTFNPIKEPSKYAGHKRNHCMMRQDSDELGKRSSYGNVRPMKIIGNVWPFGVGLNGSTKDKIAFKHPAIFPEKLAERHILSWSNEGDLVMDPMMGSGTTGKMAKMLNRNFIGIEKDKTYFDIAVKRIGEHEVEKQTSLI